MLCLKHEQIYIPQSFALASSFTKNGVFFTKALNWMFLVVPSRLLITFLFMYFYFFPVTPFALMHKCPKLIMQQIALVIKANTINMPTINMPTNSIR